MKHLPQKFDFRSKEAKNFPEMVVVGMSFLCNARCIHCPNAATNFEATLQGKDRLMSWEVLKEISRQCALHPTLMRISSFGEILLHPEAIDMICYILDHKPDKNVAFTTNGSLLTTEKAEKIMEKGIRAIEFSVDAGSKETYEKIRVGLNWETTLKNIEDCIAIRDTNHYTTKIMVSVIEQPENEKEIAAIERFWESRVDKVMIRKLLSFKGIIKRPDKYETFMPDKVPCPFLWERVVIDALGNVRGCVSDQFGELVLGNIMQEPLETLWKNDLIEHYRREHLKGNRKSLPLCKDCVDLVYRSWNYNYFYAIADK